ncbi:MAG: hypothetical protein ACI3XQ_04745, partial [Eubacteriales bacterium]
MKKSFIKSAFLLFLTVAMLLSSCIGVSAVTVATPGGSAAEEDTYYSICFENGVLSIRVNPDKVYEVIKDGNLTRDELMNFVPSDVLDLLQQEGTPTTDELAELLAKYISREDINKLIDSVPIDVLKRHFALDMFTNIISVNELLAIVPVDDIMSGIDPSSFNSLLNDEAVSLMMNQDVVQALLENPDFIDYILGDDNFTDSVLENDDFIDYVLDYDGFIDSVLNDDGFINSVFVNGGFIDSVLGDQNFIDSVLGDQSFINSVFVNGGFIDSVLGDQNFIDSALGNQNFIDSVIINSGYISAFISYVVDLGKTGDDNGFISSILTNDLICCRFSLQNTFF